MDMLLTSFGLVKFNPNHGADGRFAAGGGGERGNAATSGGGESADYAATATKDPDIAQHVSFVPGDASKNPWELTRDEYDALPTVYRGGTTNKEFVFVSNQKSIAAAHGRVRSYRLAPGTAVYADPEVIGEMDRDYLSGFESLQNGSAIVRTASLLPPDWDMWRH